MYEVYDRAIE
jgi:hypothetical protein